MTVQDVITDGTKSSSKNQRPKRGGHVCDRQTVDLVVLDDKLYRRHANGGGLVSVNATVSEYVYVAPRARIGDRAIVLGSVRLFNESVIDENAIVVGTSTLRASARIGGSALVRGEVVMGGWACVKGTAVLLGSFRLANLACVSHGTFHGSLAIG